MQDLSEIQHAIEHLPAEDQAKFVRWFSVWLMDRDRQTWDAELEQDFAPGGPGMKLLEQVDRDIAAGKSAPMLDGLKRRR